MERLNGQSNAIMVTDVAAGTVSLVTLTSVLMALNPPEYGRSVIYGVVILAPLLPYGREPGGV